MLALIIPCHRSDGVAWSLVPPLSIAFGTLIIFKVIRDMFDPGESGKIDARLRDSSTLLREFDKNL